MAGLTEPANRFEATSDVLTLFRAPRARQAIGLAPSLLLCLLLAACAPGGASSAVGDSAAAKRAAVAEGGQQTSAGGQRLPAPAQLLSSTDLSIVIVGSVLVLAGVLVRLVGRPARPP